MNTKRHAERKRKENLGRKVVERVFLLIKLRNSKFEWEFTTGDFDVYDGETKNYIFDVKYRDIYSKYTGKIYPDIVLSASKAIEMNKTAGNKRSYYFLIDKTNDNIWVVNLRKCKGWRRCDEWMQKDDYTHEKGWVDAFHIPLSDFQILSMDENGKYHEIENPYK